MSIFQELAKKDDGTTEKSDDEKEKKTGNEDEDNEIEEEFDEEDLEEVRLQITFWRLSCFSQTILLTGKKQSQYLTFLSLQANDYIESYFDNGEDFAADSDDNMDGEATYWDSWN